MLILRIHLLALPVLEEQIASETQSGVMVNQSKFQSYSDFFRRLCVTDTLYGNVHSLCLFLAAVHAGQRAEHSR